MPGRNYGLKRDEKMGAGGGQNVSIATKTKIIDPILNPQTQKTKRGVGYKTGFNNN